MEKNEGHIKLTKGAVDVFLIKGEGTRVDPQQGSFEILLKDYLEGKGTFKNSKSKNEGNLQVRNISFIVLSNINF